MKKILSFLSCAIMLCFDVHAQDVDCTKGHVLWFDKPADLDTRSSWYDRDRIWEYESFPLGNGSIGCNVFGSISAERLTFNEKTLWTGGPKCIKDLSEYWDVNKNSAHLLPEIRQAFLDGDVDKATALTEQNFNGVVDYDSAKEIPFRFGYMTSGGEFFIETGHSEIGMTDYQRVLSLDSSFVAVNYDKDGVRFHRRYFVSYPDSVLVIRYYASKPGMENLTFRFLPTPEMAMEARKTGEGEVEYSGKLVSNSMEYAIRASARNEGGRMNVSDDGKIVIEGANSVVFVIAADTDYKPNYNPDFNDPETYTGIDPKSTTRAIMNAARKKTYDELLSAHEKDYQSLFNRVRISLNPDQERPAKPVNLRLADQNNAKDDFGLQELYFQFGRYLVIAGSRKGNMPTNLQGFWSNYLDGPWHVDYHNNINLEMNYWPVESGNLEECFEPLIMLIRTMMAPGARMAKAYYNARGWTSSIATNIFGFVSPFLSTPVFRNINPTGQWLASMVYDCYDFNRDKQFLKDNYDIIKSSADFVCDYLWKRPDGTYTATPSCSPEHGPMDEGATFVHAMCREILMDAISAAEVLKTDKQSRKEWQEVLDHMSPYAIGRYGQLQEWYHDIDDPEDHHRHVNHLFGLHPGHSISPETTPELAEAAKVTLIHRGDGATGWSMGWKLNQWARLHDGNHCYQLFRNLLKDGTSDNLWDLHPPFQIDGNYGAVAGIMEMLLQSHMGFVNLLPALPDAWEDGSIKGLKARGNFTVDMIWKDGQLQKAVIISNAGTPCEVHYKDQVLRFKTKKGQSYAIGMSDGKLKLI